MFGTSKYYKIKHKAETIGNYYSTTFITFDNVRNSFAKRQFMLPAVLALCFMLKVLDPIQWRR